MKMKILLAAAAVAAMSGAAFAQESDTDGKNSPNAGAVYSSENEQAMYENNADYMGGFFTDDTMTTMVEEDAFNTNWESLSAEQQTQLKEDCEMASQNRADFSEVSVTFCSQIGAYE